MKDYRYRLEEIGIRPDLVLVDLGRGGNIGAINHPLTKESFDKNNLVQFCSNSKDLVSGHVSVSFSFLQRCSNVLLLMYDFYEVESWFKMIDNKEEDKRSAFKQNPCFALMRSNLIISSIEKYWS